MSAVGNQSGRVELTNSGDSNQSRVFDQKNGSIEMISLKNIVNKIGGKIDLLKMDCEGSEWEILEDSESLKNVNNITLEYHLWANGKSHNYPIDLLRKRGFSIIKAQSSTDFGIITATRD